MACFLVSTAEAIAVTAAKKVVEKKEDTKTVDAVEVETVHHTPLSTKLGWLCKMLWGGAFLLLIEHMWHGEVVPYFPFLTAMNSKEDTIEMLKEMATVGVSMAVLVTAFWGLICLAVHVKESKSLQTLRKRLYNREVYNMCLILTAVAAAISAVLWFTVFHDEKYNFQFLTLMYLGATLMWSVDGIFSVIEGEGFFDLSVDDAKLGVLVVILGVVLWAVTLIVRNVKTKSVKAL